MPGLKQPVLGIAATVLVMVVALAAGHAVKPLFPSRFREDMARTGTQRYAVFVDVIGEPRRALSTLTRLLKEVAPTLR